MNTHGTHHASDLQHTVRAAPHRTSGALPDESELLAALRAGDEDAFAELVGRLNGPMLRAAARYVRDPATAEDVVQITWIGFLKSLERFEGRCSIKTWLFRILFNNAKSRAQRDRRLVPFSSMASGEAEKDWSSVDPSWFRDASDPQAPGHWVESPPSWARTPEQLLCDREAADLVQRAIDEVPPAQGIVMQLRDVEGLSSKEVCNALALTESNQRVLLHRARVRVRKILSARYGSGA